MKRVKQFKIFVRLNYVFIHTYQDFFKIELGSHNDSLIFSNDGLIFDVVLCYTKLLGKKRNSILIFLEIAGQTLCLKKKLGLKKPSNYKSNTVKY